MARQLISTDSFRKPISPNIRLMFLPSISVILLIIMFLFSVNKAYQEVNKKVVEYKEGRDMENLLNSKLSTLQEIKQGLLEKANVSLLALPEDNPSLIMMSQIKKIAENNSIILNDIKISSSGGESLVLSVGIDLTLGGDLSSLMAFLNEIKTISPISSLTEVTFEGGSSSEMNVTIDVYWSQLPQVIPKINEPINKLTGEEEEELGRISALKSAEFSLLNASLDSGKTNPF